MTSFLVLPSVINQFEIVSLMYFLQSNILNQFSFLTKKMVYQITLIQVDNKLSQHFDDKSVVFWFG